MIGYHEALIYYLKILRRRRDSNPRRPCGLIRFPGVRTRPLCDFSKLFMFSSMTLNYIMELVPGIWLQYYHPT